MIILRHSKADSESAIAARVILETLGVRSLQELGVDEFRHQTDQGLGTFSTDELSASILIAPFSCLEFISSFDRTSGSRRLRLPKSIKKVFFHTVGSTQNCVELLRGLLRDRTVRLVPLDCRPTDFICAANETDICGPLAGLIIRSNDQIGCWGLVLQSRPWDTVRPLIESNGASVLLRIWEEDVEILMLFTSHLGDPNQPLRVNLDIRTCLLSLAAPVMVLKYLSTDLGWSAKNNYANLIIDDPPLSLRYGYIDFKRLYEVAAESQLSMTLAFIPWNYQRGRDASIRFFKAASDRISICIHGCSHTKSEFGCTDSVRLNALAALACMRMKSLSDRTGLAYSKIMVFPQGVFSSEALAVLKRHNFNAAVNTELDDAAGEIRVAVKDMIQPAITSFHGFPLFIRRKVSDGIGNIAFDLLLGKPCLIVTHHDDFFSDVAPVWRLVDAIKSLRNPPVWKPLEDIVARTALTRTMSSNLIELKMFSRVVDIENVPGVSSEHCLRVIKDEWQPGTIRGIAVGQRAAEWHIEAGQIVVDVGKRFDGGRLRVLYRQDEALALPRIHLNEVLSEWLRRRLSEARDNCISTSPTLKHVMGFLKRRV